jgi:glyceraldehyde-3-phosphate dehydrogenase/erythrose-4-phosphate dehydrogenase
VQGRWTGHEAKANGKQSIAIDGRAIPFTKKASPDEVLCHDTDVVLECTGKFRTTELLKGYFAAGARKVIVAAPVKEGAERSSSAGRPPECSLTDCVFEASRPTTVQEVNGLLKAAAEEELNGILGYEERPLVS